MTKYLAIPAMALMLSAACDKKSTQPEPSANALQGASATQTKRTAKPTLPIPVTLTIEQIRGAADNQVEQLIIDAALEAMGEHYDWEAEIVAAWPAGLQMIYSTWIVEAEVNNGGFNQYFWNSEGKSAQAALAGFKLIGATQHADLMERAIAVNQAEQAEMAKFKKDGSLDAFSKSYEHTKLNALDKEFYELKEDLSALRVKYIRSHPETFVTKS